EQQKEKAAQEQVQAQMVAVNKERADLEKKTNDIQARINAIQSLRASQQGPRTVLREIKSRIDSIPGLYLKSVEQKGAELTIKGNYGPAASAPQPPAANAPAKPAAQPAAPANNQVAQK